MTTAQYHYLAVDGSVTNVARRYHTTLENLWRLNDPHHRFASAEAWAGSIRPLAEIVIEYSAEETRWEWDLWTDITGNPTLQEFCDQRNTARERLAARNRPVGPRLTPAFLWNSLINAEFRHQSIMREARAPGARSEDVENLEHNPHLAYLRPQGASGQSADNFPIYVPAAPVSRTAATNAVPRTEGGQAANVLHVQPQWVRALQDRLFDIRQKTAELRRMLVREHEVAAQCATTLATFSRLHELLNIVVDGRNNGVYAAASAATLAEVASIRTQFTAIENRVARLAAQRRELAVPSAAKTRVSNELRDLLRASQLTELLRTAAQSGIVLNQANITSAAHDALSEAYRAGCENGSEWAYQDIQRALTPAPQSAASTLALSIAVITPLIGNTPGPPSGWVWLMQYHATRELQQIMNGTLTGASASTALQRLIARCAALGGATVTPAQYRMWMQGEALEDLAYLGLLSQGSRADPAAVAAAAERAEAAARAAAPVQEIYDDIQRTIFDQGLSRAERTARLRRIANDRLTGRANTSTGMSGILVVLNLILIASTAYQEATGNIQWPEAIAGILGCSYTSAMAIFQILANRTPTGWCANFLEVAGPTLGHVAAALGVIQGIVGAYSTWRDWGFSHPNALIASVFSVGAGVLLWFGWAVAFPPAAAVGIVLALSAAILSLVGDDDPAVKVVFMSFVQELARSPGIRDFELFLVDHPDGQEHGSTLRLDLLAVRTAAQRTTFAKPVWDEIPALQSLGFSLADAQRMTEAQPRENVGLATHPRTPLAHAH